MQIQHRLKKRASSECVHSREARFYLILNVGRTGLLVDIKCPVAVADNGFCTGHPRAVVAEEAGVLFISRRIAGNLAQLFVIRLDGCGSIK